MNVLRVGQQLASRGHNFTFVLSEQEQHGRSVLEKIQSRDTTLLTYTGDSHFTMLGKRPKDQKQPKAARDPAQVGPGNSSTRFERKANLLAKLAGPASLLHLDYRYQTLSVMY